MPQLDFFTLLFQFKSFFLIFLSIYLLFVFVFVPRLHFIISLRRLQVLNLLFYFSFLRSITYFSFSSQSSILKASLNSYNQIFFVFFSKYLNSRFNISNFLFSNIL